MQPRSGLHRRSARRLRIIDYYEASGAGLSHYVKRLSEWPYVYAANHLLPHDVEVRELGSGTTRLETLRRLGIKVRVLRQNAVEDGIEAVRDPDAALLVRYREMRPWIGCPAALPAGIRCQAPCLQRAPLHDWTSHAADAFRYLATGLKAPLGPFAETDATLAETPPLRSLHLVAQTMTHRALNVA